jgi:hypothetical protein
MTLHRNIHRLSPPDLGLVGRLRLALHGCAYLLDIKP